MSSPESILRIGSFKEVSANCQKFTLEKRREESADWKEAKELEKLIKKQNQSIHSLENEKYKVKSEIRDLKTKKINYSNNIDSILDTKEKYRIKSLKFNPSKYKVNEELLNLEMRCKKLNKESENLSNLATSITES